MMEESNRQADMITVKQPRNSSIELLRIIAACMVVVLHYNGRALGISTGLSHHGLAFLETVCVCAVDLFIIISGYFLCKTQKRTWGKPVFLFLVLSLIASIGYISKSYILMKGGGKLDHSDTFHDSSQELFCTPVYHLVYHISIHQHDVEQVEQ